RVVVLRIVGLYRVAQVFEILVQVDETALGPAIFSFDAAHEETRALRSLQLLTLSLTAQTLQHEEVTALVADVEAGDAGRLLQWNRHGAHPLHALLQGLGLYQGARTENLHRGADRADQGAQLADDLPAGALGHILG